MQVYILFFYYHHQINLAVNFYPRRLQRRWSEKCACSPSENALESPNLPKR
jgi:hypothetical protein